MPNVVLVTATGYPIKSKRRVSPALPVVWTLLWSSPSAPSKPPHLHYSLSQPSPLTYTHSLKSTDGAFATNSQHLHLPTALPHISAHTHHPFTTVSLLLLVHYLMRFSYFPPVHFLILVPMKTPKENQPWKRPNIFIFFCSHSNQTAVFVSTFCMSHGYLLKHKWAMYQSGLPLNVGLKQRMRVSVPSFHTCWFQFKDFTYGYVECC